MKAHSWEGPQGPSGPAFPPRAPQAGVSTWGSAADRRGAPQLVTSTEDATGLQFKPGQELANSTPCLNITDGYSRDILWYFVPACIWEAILVLAFIRDKLSVFHLQNE